MNNINNYQSTDPNKPNYINPLLMDSNNRDSTGSNNNQQTSTQIPKYRSNTQVQDQRNQSLFRELTDEYKRNNPGHNQQQQQQQQYQQYMQDQSQQQYQNQQYHNQQHQPTQNQPKMNFNQLVQQSTQNPNDDGRNRQFQMQRNLQFLNQQSTNMPRQEQIAQNIVDSFNQPQLQQRQKSGSQTGGSNKSHPQSNELKFHSQQQIANYKPQQPSMFANKPIQQQQYQQNTQFQGGTNQQLEQQMAIRQQNKSTDVKKEESLSTKIEQIQILNNPVQNQNKITKNKSESRPTLTTSQFFQGGASPQIGQSYSAYNRQNQYSNASGVSNQAISQQAKSQNQGSLNNAIIVPDNSPNQSSAPAISQFQNKQIEPPVVVLNEQQLKEKQIQDEVAKQASLATVNWESEYGTYYEMIDGVSRAVDQSRKFKYRPMDQSEKSRLMHERITTGDIYTDELASFQQELHKSIKASVELYPDMKNLQTQTMINIKELQMNCISEQILHIEKNTSWTKEQKVKEIIDWLHGKKYIQFMSKNNKFAEEMNDGRVRLCHFTFQYDCLRYFTDDSLIPIVRMNYKERTEWLVKFRYEQKQKKAQIAIEKGIISKEKNLQKEKEKLQKLDINKSNVSGSNSALLPGHTRYLRPTNPQINYSNPYTTQSIFNQRVSISSGTSGTNKRQQKQSQKSAQSQASSKSNVDGWKMLIEGTGARKQECGDLSVDQLMIMMGVQNPTDVQKQFLESCHPILQLLAYEKNGATMCRMARNGHVFNKYAQMIHKDIPSQALSEEDNILDALMVIQHYIQTETDSNQEMQIMTSFQSLLTDLNQLNDINKYQDDAIGIFAGIMSGINSETFTVANNLTKSGIRNLLQLLMKYSKILNTKTLIRDVQPQIVYCVLKDASSVTQRFDFAQGIYGLNSHAALIVANISSYWTEQMMSQVHSRQGSVEEKHANVLMWIDDVNDPIEFETAFDWVENIVHLKEMIECCKFQDGKLKYFEISESMDALNKMAIGKKIDWISFEEKLTPFSNQKEEGINEFIAVIKSQQDNDFISPDAIKQVMVNYRKFWANQPNSPWNQQNELLVHAVNIWNPEDVNQIKVDNSWYCGFEDLYLKATSYLTYLKPPHTLFPFQKLLVCSILRAYTTHLKLTSIDSHQYRYFVQAPPSHGKSVMIAALANCLLEYSKENPDILDIQKIYVICFNGYLTKTASSKYANPEFSAYENADNENEQIIYIPWEEFVDKSTEDLKNERAIAILDEVDQLALEKLISIRKEEIGDPGDQYYETKWTMQKVTQKLAYFERLFCFTGSNQRETSQSLQVLDKDNINNTAAAKQLTFTIEKLQGGEQKNKVNSWISYELVNEHGAILDPKSRFAKILKSLTQYKTMPQIIIDENLPTTQQELYQYPLFLHLLKLKENGTYKDFFCLNDWTADNYFLTEEVIKQIGSVNQSVVVLCDVEGSRGVDLKFKDAMPAHVTIGITPKVGDYAKVWQALSRGSRDYKKTCIGTIIACRTQIYDEFGINCKDSMFIMRAMQEQFQNGNPNISRKVRMAQLHHDVELTVPQPTKVSSSSKPVLVRNMLRIFNDASEPLNFGKEQVATDAHLAQNDKVLKNWRLFAAAFGYKSMFFFPTQVTDKNMHYNDLIQTEWFEKLAKRKHWKDVNL